MAAGTTTIVTFSAGNSADAKTKIESLNIVDGDIVNAHSISTGEAIEFSQIERSDLIDFMKELLCWFNKEAKVIIFGPSL